jgi:hypothetical protein
VYTSCLRRLLLQRCNAQTAKLHAASAGDHDAHTVIDVHIISSTTLSQQELVKVDTRAHLDIADGNIGAATVRITKETKESVVKAVTVSGSGGTGGSSTEEQIGATIAAAAATGVTATATDTAANDTAQQSIDSAAAVAVASADAAAAADVSSDITPTGSATGSTTAGSEVGIALVVQRLH